MSVRSRLSRLEQAAHRRGGCGPGCPPLRMVRDADFYGTPRPRKPPAPCPRCGRAAKVIRVVRDPDFFGNAERLRESRAQSSANAHGALPEGGGG